ncbi:ubiquinone/menaquinone biosynthesis methyltransferase [Rickettsiales bacterium]|nr:ubiquinone/menaquinone biosynthesis methyltransferase [Rickettsiales bacterium]
MKSFKFKNLTNISPNKKSKIVSKVFSDVSENYDFMNDIMSIGMHRIWKEQIFNFIAAKKHNVFMDLAGGSGDLSKLIKDKYPDSRCILVDSNPDMISQAKKKLKDYDITYKCNFAENLPFKDDEFDYVLLAFGLRNFSDMKKSLIEIHRVLDKNGKFICLEFSQANQSILRNIVDLYFNIIPKIGKIIAKNESAYEYLVESIRFFPNQIELTKIFNTVGFNNVECFDILDGIASIHIGKK